MSDGLIWRCRSCVAPSQGSGSYRRGEICSRVQDLCILSNDRTYKSDAFRIYSVFDRRLDPGNSSLHIHPEFNAIAGAALGRDIATNLKPFAAGRRSQSQPNDAITKQRLQICCGSRRASKSRRPRVKLQSRDRESEAAQNLKSTSVLREPEGIKVKASEGEAAVTRPRTQGNAEFEVHLSVAGAGGLQSQGVRG